MYYEISIKKTDPFTQAWSMQSRGWMTFAQVLQTVAALEKRINHPPHAIKVTCNETNESGKWKTVMKWSRIEEHHAQLTDEIAQLENQVANYELKVL